MNDIQDIKKETALLYNIELEAAIIDARVDNKEAASKSEYFFVKQ